MSWPLHPGSDYPSVAYNNIPQDTVELKPDSFLGAPASDCAVRTPNMVTVWTLDLYPHSWVADVCLPQESMEMASSTTATTAYE
ncbi:hypothetical protein DPV78_003143 [Talaromyces pinophilus]|nr:hypothetical protein DPV78_003143 [Talaromyces pinophilus]